jgi:DNA recombination protein RmuC
MIELLLGLTLIAATASAGLIAVLLLRERASAREAREELSRSLMTFSQTVSTHMSSIATVQGGQLEAFAQRLESFRRTLDESLARVQEQQRLSAKDTRDTLEQRLERLQQENAAKLEQMRQTVDEKLHATLEQRLSESFKQVSERLELVHKGLGEMHSLASGVGDLKRVLTNVRTRGTWGEVQLGALLEQLLVPDQYAANVATRPGSSQRVEYAIRLPGRETQAQVWLPIDSKFPSDDYDRLVAAQERADKAAVEEAARALEARVKAEAKAIREKYVEPPATTDFAIMFVPTEGLYAEIARRPGLAASVQTEHRVTIAGPMNLSMIINSLQMGFRTLAIERRASEVWLLLSAVKSEFGKFGEVLARTKAQLQGVANSIDAAEVRTRQMARKLKDVELLPEADVQELLDSAQEEQER